IGAELDRDELIEGGLGDGDGGVRGDVEVEEGREEAGREPWVFAEDLDEGVVLERRHRARRWQRSCPARRWESAGRDRGVEVAAPVREWRAPLSEASPAARLPPERAGCRSGCSAADRASWLSDARARFPGERPVCRTRAQIRRLGERFVGWG